MAEFHYEVRAKLIRKKNEKGEYEFLEVEEKFEDENPIEARRKAFRFYQNYVDVLLQAKGNSYKNHQQASEIIQSFWDSGTKEYNINGKKFNLPDTFDNGMAVIMVIAPPIKEGFDVSKEGHKLTLHGFGNLLNHMTYEDRFWFDLAEEYEYYVKYGYNTQNEEKEVTFCSQEDWYEAEEGEWPEKKTILTTPYDWSGKDTPYWWREDDEEESEEEENWSPESLEEIISEGESNQVEFKPALVYNFKTELGGIGVKAHIAKAICAFLNSNGGLLLIGVSDNGEVLGLSHDYSLAGDKEPKDFFKLEFDHMLKHFLPGSIMNQISTLTLTHEEKEVFIISVRPSARGPIFLNGQNGKEFYVRGEASSRHLYDPEDIANFCIEKWGNSTE